MHEEVNGWRTVGMRAGFWMSMDAIHNSVHGISYSYHQGCAHVAVLLSDSQGWEGIYGV